MLGRVLVALNALGIIAITTLWLTHWFRFSASHDDYVSGLWITEKQSGAHVGFIKRNDQYASCWIQAWAPPYFWAPDAIGFIEGKPFIQIQANRTQLVLWPSKE